TRRCAGGSHRARTVQLRDCAGACVRRERRRPSWKERTECSRGTADTGKPEVRSRKSEVQVRARGTGPPALTFELPASNFFRPQTSDFRLQTWSFLLARAFRHDADFEVRRDVAMELHRNGVLAELLDGLRELQLAAVQLEAFGGERIGDVAAGDRAVERLGLADLARNLDLDARHPLRHGLGDLLILELFHVELHALALDLFLV